MKEMPQRRMRKNQSFGEKGNKMGLVLNLIVQTIVWFGFMGAIIFVAAGTTDYTGGWLYLGAMVALSLVLGTVMVRVDPGLLRERLKPPVQRDQPLADKLILIPILLLIFGGMGFMAADAARWHWSAMPSSVQWAGCGLLLAALLFIYRIMRTNRFATPVVKIQKNRGQAVITTGPYAVVRHPMYFGALFYIAGHPRTQLVAGTCDRPHPSPLVWHPDRYRGADAAYGSRGL